MDLRGQSHLLSGDVPARASVGYVQATRTGALCTMVITPRRPASRVRYVPEAQGSLPPELAPTYRTYWVRVPASGVVYSAPLPLLTPPRRETWIQLRRFEDVVQRQFEELRRRNSSQP